MKRVVENYILFPLKLKILFHVLSHPIDFTVWSVFELLDDKVRVVYSSVVDEDRDSETTRVLQVARTVNSFEEESGDVVVVTNIRPFRIVFLKRVAADVALCRVLILFPLLGTHALNYPMCPELRHDRLCQLDEHAQELGKSILKVFDNF